MAKWKQNTEVVGVKTYPERIIDSDELLGMMAQCHLNRQAGVDFTLKTEVNDKYAVTAYVFITKNHDRTAISRFEKI